MGMDAARGRFFVRNLLRDRPFFDYSNSVEWFHIPLDGFHADGAHGVDGVVVVIAIGQADQSGAHTGDGLDLVVAGV